MAASSTPHFQNDMGLSKIEIGAREFMCVGAKPPFDHPHVFLNMGVAEEIVCPYCSTLFRHSAKLKPNEASPAAAVWHDEAA
ncbi:MAG TPA: zinc-finger domain-containing protein [Aestuariivirga sp.]|nr:zinc-finger domain-containing protein [Aestuariivirga sp.]